MGDTVGSLETGGVQSHKHNYASHGGDCYKNNYGGATSSDVYTENDTTTIASAATGGVETRPKNAYINFVILFM